MENRNGIMVDLRLGQATGRAECEQRLDLLEEVDGLHRVTVAADTAEFAAACRALNVTPGEAAEEVVASATDRFRWIRPICGTRTRRIGRRIGAVQG